jgi:hypothetical protein
MIYMGPEFFAIVRFSIAMKTDKEGFDGVYVPETIVCKRLPQLYTVRLQSIDNESADRTSIKTKVFGATISTD